MSSRWQLLNAPEGLANSDLQDLQWNLKMGGSFSFAVCIAYEPTSAYFDALVWPMSALSALCGVYFRFSHLRISVYRSARDPLVIGTTIHRRAAQARCILN